MNNKTVTNQDLSDLPTVLQTDSSKADETPKSTSLYIQPVTTQDTTYILYPTATGVSSDFKDAMDSYETFIDGYIEFMEEYENSNNVVGMLSEYLKYMTQYIDVMEKLDSISEDLLSDADALYYLEVNTRIYMKLAEIQ